MWVINHNTTKYQYHYGSSGDLYYSKTLIKFKKTSSSPPIFVYYTVHFDDDGGDMNTYPKEFKNQVYLVAYGIEGLSDHVHSEVYDAHEAFEIDKTKMKMLVPLDMNGKKLMNTNYDLKFKDLFKIFKCYFKVGQQGFRTLLHSKFNNQVVSFASPVVLHSINLHKTGFNNEKIRILGISNAEDIFINLNRNLSYTYMNMTHFTMMFIIDSGIRYIELRRYKGTDFDVDLALAFNYYILQNKMKHDIFEFNHIDSLLSEEEVKTLKEFYKYYHKKFWCFKKTFKHFKIIDESITISGILLVIIGTISGGLTLNPVILGVINGVGILLTNFGKMKNYKEKIELLKIAFTTYDKVLVELRSAMRGDEFDKDQFIDKMKVVDAMIIDQTPLAGKYVKQYDKKYK